MVHTFPGAVTKLQYASTRRSDSVYSRGTSFVHARAAQQGYPKPWKQCGHPTSTASQYLSSFYFIIYTMMTVGYGDQSAEATSKKVCYGRFVRQDYGQHPL